MWRFIFLSIAFLASAHTGWAEKVLTSVPANLDALREYASDIQQGTVTILMDGYEEPAQWRLSTTQVALLLNKLTEPLLMAPRGHPNDAFFGAIPNRLPAYQGLHIQFGTYTGTPVAPIVIGHGYITTPNGNILDADPGRELELWLFGTTNVLRNKLIAVQAVPIFTFAQCVLMGNVIINTTPRQCLLPDNNIMLDVQESLTISDVLVTDFDSCLKQGKALIDTFPRRCMARGGKVFTEPPRLDAPGFKPLTPQEALESLE